MITYQQNRPRWRPWAYALVGLAIVAGAAWWWKGGRGLGGEGSAGAAVPPTVVASAVRAASAPVVALLVEPRVLEDGRPSDFSAEDWRSLKDAMARTPNPQAELDRVVKYLRFQKGFQQWQALKGGDTATRQALAQRLLDQVPERLAQSEVTFTEATMIQSALLEDLEPNADQRKQKLQLLQVQLQATAPQIDPAEQARNEELEREYKRREAAIVADYQSRPEAQRDHAKLERDLDAARRAVWGSKP